MSLAPHELKALALELAAAMPPIEQRPGHGATGPILIDNSLAVSLRLESIAGIADCIEAAAALLTNPDADHQPPDRAIPAACRGIGFLVENLEALLMHSPPVLRMPAPPAKDGCA